MPSAVSKGRSRPSRVSSPLVRTNTPTVAPKEWTEPDLADDKPSYEDHGGAPFGVLEDMQAIGQKPNAKVRTRVKEASLRKSLGKGSAGLVQEVVDTPEGTPVVETPRSASLPQDAPSPQVIPLVQEDEKDDDYQPRTSKRSTRARLSRGAATPSEAPKSSPTPAPATTKTSSTPTTTTEPVKRPGTTQKKAPKKVPQRKHKIKNLGKIVEAAVERSQELGNPDLGAAIQRVYYDSFDNDRLTHILQVILNQTATEEEGAEFRGEITKAKKAVRKQNKEAQIAMDAQKEEQQSVQETITPKTNGDRKNTTSSKAAKSQTATRPEMVPRPSIEGVLAVPKIKLSVRQPKQEPAVEPPPPKMKDLTSPSHSRNGSESSSTSLSSLTSAGGDHMEVDEHLSVPPQVQKNNLKRTSADAELAVDERDKALAVKKQKLRETVYKEPPPQDQAKESHIREPSEKPRALRHQAAINYSTAPSATMNGPISTPTVTASRSKRERTESPLSDLSTPPASQHNTPRGLHVKDLKQKAKTKQSPEKKQLSSRTDQDGSGGRASPSGYDDEDLSSENNDYCNSCGGAGFLLCCDGCDNSFHLACLDPPLVKGSTELDEPFFCHTCVAKRQPPTRQPRGLFSQLLQNLEKRNSMIFVLPQHIRDYFHGVNTGKDGNFAEPSNTKTRSRAGYDEPLDLTKTRDGRGNTILCYKCGKSASGKREIITCDACNNHWHLDCTDPPLANPPFRDQWNRKVREWTCPLHVEHDLREIDTSRIAIQRTIHLRRPKLARVIDTSLRRGQRNNGIIEVIEDSSSEDEMSEFGEVDEAQEFGPPGTVYRLPARGIKLDFIYKVESERKVKQQAHEIARAHQAILDTPAVRRENFTKRPFIEKQTALSLVQFAQQNSNDDIKLNGDKVDNLVGTLIAEAPEKVVELLTKAEVGTKAKPGLGDEQRKELLMLQELIKRRLEAASADDDSVIEED